MRLAVNFTADFDTMLLRRLLNEPPQQLAKGEFGGRVGIWRLIELFDSHEIKATIFTPGRICELYPNSLRAAAKSGHEIADHMWEHHVPKEPELERDHLRKTIAAIEKTVGKKPVGTRSNHSRELLLEHGYVYISEDSMDHRPNWLSAPDGVEADPEPAVPLRHRRRDVLQLRLAGQRQQRPAHDGPRPCRGDVVAHVRAVLSRRRLHEHLHASVRVGPRAAHRHARPADQPHEGAARRVVPELRGGRPPHHRSAKGAQ